MEEYNKQVLKALGYVDAADDEPQPQPDEAADAGVDMEKYQQQVLEAYQQMMQQQVGEQSVAEEPSQEEVKKKPQAKTSGRYMGQLGGPRKEPLNVTNFKAGLPGANKEPLKASEGGLDFSFLDKQLPPSTTDSSAADASKGGLDFSFLDKQVSQTSPDSSSADSAKKPEPEDTANILTITLDTDEHGMKLDSEGAELKVQAIPEGSPADMWNAYNPGKEIKVGDSIIEVNGKAGTPGELVISLFALGPGPNEMKIKSQTPKPKPKAKAPGLAAAQVPGRTPLKAPITKGLLENPLQNPIQQRQTSPTGQSIANEILKQTSPLSSEGGLDFSFVEQQESQRAAPLANPLAAAAAQPSPNLAQAQALAQANPLSSLAKAQPAGPSLSRPALAQPTPGRSSLSQLAQIARLRHQQANPNTEVKEAEEEEVPMQPTEVTVMIEGGDHGIKLDAEGPEIKVQGISPGGTAALWNKRNPSKEIRVGDAILAVNGKSGDPGELIIDLYALEVGRQHELTIRSSPLPAAKLPGAKPSGRHALGGSLMTSFPKASSNDTLLQQMTRSTTSV